MNEPNWDWWGRLIDLLTTEEKRMSELHAFVGLVAGGGDDDTATVIAEALAVVEQAFQEACWEIYALGYPYPERYPKRPRPGWSA